MPRWLLLGLLASCRFDPAGEPFPGEGPDAAALDGAGPDAPPPSRLCGPDPELLACFRFDGDPQVIVDESAYGNHGSSTGATSVDGHDGLALGVDAASLVTVPETASLEVPGPLTVEMWVRVDALPPSGVRSGLIDHNGQWGLFLSPALEVRCHMGGATVIGLAITLGTWTHLACTYDRERVQLYQDGVPGPSIAATAAINTAPIDGIRIGQDSPMGDPLIGAIDDLRIWQVARAPDRLAR